MDRPFSIHGNNCFNVKIVATAFLLTGLVFSGLFGQDEEALPEMGDTPEEQGFVELKTEAEAQYLNKSFTLAHEVYQRIQRLELSVEERRWAEFRLADTRWRAHAASGQHESGPISESRQELEKLAQELDELEGPPLALWVDIQESLGDSWWNQRQFHNWGQAWNHYKLALDWLAGSKDLPTARQRYLKIVWRATGVPDSIGPRTQIRYWHGNALPLEILENALKIAQSPADRAQAHYLLAMTLRRQGGRPQMLARVADEFAAAIELGTNNPWYDDALFQYAEWSSQSGLLTYDENGNQHLEPDFEKALLLYRRILNEYSKGETGYYESTQRAIENIVKPYANVFITHAYLPGAQPKINLNWRNIEAVKVSLFPVDLKEAVRFANSKKRSQHNWIDTIDTKEIEPWHSFTLDKEAKRPYYPITDQHRLNREIPAGAYVVEADGGNSITRDILLVTDAALVLKSTEKEVLVYFCDSFSGAPLEDAEVVIWERGYDGRNWHVSSKKGTTDSDGLALFKSSGKLEHRDYFASARHEDRQAFAQSQGYYYGNFRDFQWKAYTYTDRPAYRPGSTAQWKVIARQHDADSYRVPTDELIRFTITDPRGQKVDEGVLKLNAFGAAWGKTDLNEEMPLGAYQIQFNRHSTNEYIGQAQLFRLEEYKLPEFKVTIGMADVEDAAESVFRLGDTVTGKIQADYYFGGPVPNAQIELVIYQRPFYHWWTPQRSYDWLYTEQNPYINFDYGGPGSVIERKTLQTDTTGAATFSFDTPQSSQHDYQYTVEARVTDASRREITASETLKVTRQSYLVYLKPEHQIYQPGDTAEISIRSMDANSRPISAQGRLRLTREYWRETWIDDRGREISGQQMEELRQKSPRRFTFGASVGDYRLKEKGYEVEEIEVIPLTTDEKGEAIYRTPVPMEGYFKIAWVSREENGQPIKADTAFWSSRESDLEIGYRPGGVSIVVDKNSFQPGEKAPVMISTPVSGRTVLFTIGAAHLQSYQLLRLDGTVKLLYLDIGNEHIPNTFLEALMVSGHEMFLEQKEIVVPPERNFLQIEVSADAEGYQPGEKGSYTIRATNWQGEPVSAEISLGLVDDAIYYIQPELAPDIRQFFYGEKRRHAIWTASTFNYRPYFKIEETEEIAKKDSNANANTARGSISSVGKKEGSGRAIHMSMLGGNVELEEFSADAQGPMPQEPAVQVRTDFRETVFWQPDIQTDENGLAEVDVTFPDSLTTWRASARGVAQQNRFGVATDTRQTRLPLIASLQAPRFFVIGDRLIVSGIFHNNTSVPMPVEALLETDDGLKILGVVGDNGEITEGPSGKLSIPANSQAHLDWQVAPKTQGEVKIKLTGKSHNFADAMEKTYPVYEHGIEKFVGKSGRLQGDAVIVSLDIPAERKKASTTFSVQATPSLAVSMLDALPYLIDFPYGCTEQTLSRFLPSVLVAKTLRDMNLEPTDIAGKIFGGLEKEHADAAHRSRPKDLRQLRKMVQAGLERLYDFQHADGGWGWWKKGSTDPYMSAYVLWGLTLAEQADVEVKKSTLERARSYVEKVLVESEFAYDMQAWLLHALAVRFTDIEDKRPSRFEASAFLNLMRNREQLNSFTRALLALSARHFGFEEEARLLVQNLRDGVKIDKSPDQSILLTQNGSTSPAVMATAHWGESGVFWRWSDGGVESTSFALMALLAIEPESDLIEPVMNWLVKNRRGGHWSNTRDSAMALLALNQYLETTKELESDLTYEIRVNGHVLAKGETGGGNWLSGQSQWRVPHEWLLDGGNEVEIRRLTGQGSLYFSTQAEFFSLEEPIPPAGNEIFVRRDYHRLRSVPTLLKGFVEEKVPLNDGDSLQSGDRIEVVLTIEGKNDYEYLIFEDLKPAGLEAVQIRSGEALYASEIQPAEVNADGAEENERLTGNSRWVYQELRDRKVALFIDKLPEGYWEIRYRLRAETPGEFHALPVLGHAMYVPEIRANSAEIRLTVED